MFKKILVATDSSAMSEQIFDRALFLAMAANASLMLLHVLSADEDDSPSLPVYLGLDHYQFLAESSLDAYRQEWEAFKDARLQWLRNHAETAMNAGVPTEFSQNYGNPGRTICELAQTWGADLIVVGRRGRSGLSELVLGSVSNYVLHHAPCSVMTVQALAPAVPKPEAPAMATAA